MQGGDSYRIVVRRGPQPNQVFDLKDDVVNLGRDITNTISINDREVSRHHLRFTRSAEGYTIEDLGSTNGTFINGKRLSGAALLKNGDMIGLGETVTLGYEMVRPGGMPVPPAAPASPYQAPVPPAAAASPFQPPAAPGAPAQPPAASPYVPPTPNPFQQPPQPGVSPYAPPAGPGTPYAPPAGPGAPYPPPAPSYGAPADPYQQPAYGAPPPADPYQQPAYGDPNQAYYAQQGFAPPPPGYDYDPYAMRETEGRSTTRMILLGCLGLMFFCCCFTIISIVLVDTFNLYCQIPVVNQVLRALGLITCAAG